MASAPSTSSTPSNFEALFDSALSRYKRRTGQDLRNHPLAAVIDRCQSPTAILAVFQEQSRAFDEFRNGNAKLTRFLTPIVNGLHTISTSTVTSTGASLVSPLTSPSSVFYYQHTSTFTSGIPSTTYFFWNWRPPLRACHSSLTRSSRLVTMSASARRPST